MAAVSEADDDPLPSGTVFGAYRIERRLGAGGVGAVYRAIHMGLHKAVVLKVLHPQYAQSQNLRARFAREGRAAAAIRHPHVVDVTDVGEHQGTPYLIMELLEGESLGDMLHRLGALSPDRAVDLLLPVVAAVDAAHCVGVVHRDLKPDNLFIARGATGEPFPKVLDFGISRVVSNDGAHRTGTAAMLGTPAYMAPEQIASTRDADARSDQYALGVILYECLTGAVAFNGDNVYAILKAVGDGRFTPPRAIRPDLPPALEAVVLRAMSLNPVSRFPALRAMAAALLPFASERARITWGASFSPGAAHGHADTHLTATSAPPTPRDEHADTLHDAAHAHDSITTPMSHDRSRRPLAIGLAVGLIALLTGGALSLAWRTSPSQRGAVAASTPAAQTPLASPRPSEATRLAAPAIPVAIDASPPPVPLSPTPPTIASPTHTTPTRNGASPRRLRRQSPDVNASAPTYIAPGVREASP